MCGIVGVVYRDPQRQPDATRLRAAADVLIHRGPDQEGYWQEAGVGFAHRRLAILDVHAGRQPMVDDRSALVYNGEVYNYLDLQQHELTQPDGLRFTTRCDTEVVFRRLERDGARCLDDFNGMFALAHWQRQERQLLLARDRLGKKPLYWFADADCFAFASELKALLKLLGRKFALDLAAVDQFLQRGYIPAPRTIFGQIHKLPAGCTLTLDAARWRHAVARWWDYQPVATATEPAQVLDELDELLTDAVRLRLVSDVPLGCLLSGGIDSTLITAIASRLRDEPIDAFTVAFSDGGRLDESRFAQMAAEHHRCRWHCQRVETDDFPAMLTDVAQLLDEPFANFAVFPTRRLAQLARQKLTVVLTGQGSDELSAGYAGRYGWTQQPPPAGNAAYSTMDDLALHLHHSSIVPWANGRVNLYAPAMRQWVEQRLSPVEHLQPFWRRHPQLDRLNTVLYADVRTNLPEYLITVEERMTMSASLEARNPMLDVRVVNYLLSLPMHLKVRGSTWKWPMLELAKRYGPAAAVDRPKQGFTPPMAQWISQTGPRLAPHFQAAEAALTPLFSADWRRYLLAGRYDVNLTFPVYFSLALATWIEQFGEYLETPTAELFASAPASTAAANPPGEAAAGVGARWHGALRTLDAVQLAHARLVAHVCQQTLNRQPTAIVGPDADFWAKLAGDAGLVVLPEPSITHPAPRVLTASLAAAIALDASTLAPDAAVVVVQAFPLAQAAQLQQQLQALAGTLALKSHQVVKFDAQHGALLLLAQPLAQARQRCA